MYVCMCFSVSLSKQKDGRTRPGAPGICGCVCMYVCMYNIVISDGTLFSMCNKYYSLSFISHL